MLVTIICGPHPGIKPISTAINGVRVWASSAVVEAPHLVIARLEDEINFKLLFFNNNSLTFVTDLTKRISVF